MKRKNAKKKNKLLVLLTLLLAVTIGYAVLSTTLKINGTAGIKSNQWDIHWENVQPNAQSTVTTEKPQITENATKVTYTVDLELPGDYYEFTVDAKNDGTINGKITKVDHKVYAVVNGDVSTEATTLPSYIKYSIYYDGTTTPPALDDILNAGAKQTYRIRIEYDPEATTLPSSDLTFQVVDEITYTQTKEGTVVPDPDYGGEATNADAELGLFFYEINNDGDHTASIVAVNYAYTQELKDLYDYAFNNPDYDLGGTPWADVHYEPGREWYNGPESPDYFKSIVVPKTVPLNNEGKYAPNGGEDYTITRVYSSYSANSSYGEANVSQAKYDYINANNGSSWYDLNWAVESLIFPDTVTYMDSGLTGFNMSYIRISRNLTSLPSFWSNWSDSKDPRLTVYVPKTITALTADRYGSLQICGDGTKVNTLYVPATVTSIPANSIDQYCDAAPNIVVENNNVKSLFEAAGYTGNLSVDASKFNY